MSSHFKKHSHLLLTFFALTLVIVGSLFAGSLTPPTPSPEPTMYTLEDIYNLIHNNATSTHSLSTSTSPAKSMHSVSDIYVDLANLINANNVASGTTYLGVTGGGTTPAPLTTVTIPFTPVTSAGTAIGYTLDDVYNLITENNRILTPGHAFTTPALSSSQHTLNEIYTGLTTLITPANVKSGVTYLGVAGSYVEFVANPVWVSNQSSNSVSKIDGSTNTVVAIVPVGNYPIGIAVDASGNVWVANYANSVSKINGLTNEFIATVPVGGYPTGIAVDAIGNVWVTHVGLDSVSKINGLTNAVTTVSLPAGSSPMGIAVDARGNVWVTNNDSSSVSKIDGSTNTVSATVTVGGHPNGIAVDASGNILVANSGSNSVSKIDVSNNNAVTNVTVGNYPIGIAVDASGNVWVANYSSNSVSKIDVSNNNAVTTISVGAGPRGIAVDASGNVWVTNYFSNYVSKIDVSNSNAVTNVIVGGANSLMGDFTGYALKHFVIDIFPPKITSFSISATSSSLTVPINTFIGTDNGIIAGYKLTESATPPLAGDLGWTPATSTTYTFDSVGSKTLYAWAKDAAGNVSITTPSSTGAVMIDLCSHVATDPNCWSTQILSVLAWGPTGTTTGAQSDTLGLANTNHIIENHANSLPYNAGSDYPAARYCYDSNEGGYTDWYLPAKQQLIDGLTNQFITPGGTVTGFAGFTLYWSSTEFSGSPENYAWFAGYNSYGGLVVSDGDNKGSTGGQARCLR